MDGWINKWVVGWMEGRKEMFYLTTHSSQFIYGYMASDMMDRWMDGWINKWVGGWMD